MDANLARDHLANERTYLAWLRTGVAVMALGIAIAGFSDATTATSIAAGAILVLAGTGGVAYGTVRYRDIGRRLLPAGVRDPESVTLGRQFEGDSGSDAGTCTRDERTSCCHAEML